MTSFNPKNIVIWDGDGKPPKFDGFKVLWSEFFETSASDMLSIPSLVEKNAEKLRSRYLSWIYDLGESKIDGKRLIDHLELRPGFSYWWMTLLVEKCNVAKSPQITDAVKLLAFDDWAGNRPIEHVVLVSNNKALAKCIQLWSDKYNIKFRWQRLPAVRRSLSIWRHIYVSLPSPVKSWVWLFHHIVSRWPLKGVGLKEWKQSKGHLTFISYLFNLVPASADMGKFESRYWGNLHDELTKNKCKTNCLHLFIKDGYLSGASKAMRKLKDFNRNSSGKQVHVSLDSFLSIKVIVKTIKDWFKIGNAAKVFDSKLIDLNRNYFLWPLITEDWQQSVTGLTAMSNLLYFNLLESAMKVLPSQTMGVYLQENQGWEFGLLQAWKTAGHGQIVGHPHSTVRYWDLRYFFDKRTYNRAESKNPMPLPDKVALNGQVAQKNYVQGGYPANDLIQVEALRYLYLREFGTKQMENNKNLSGSLRLLVLGDYVWENTWKQMELLKNAAPYFPVETIITVKPHPICPIKEEDYPTITMNVTMEPIPNLLQDSDVAYTSAVTSAAVDAYCAGLPVITALDQTSLNMSPLRGFNGVIFVGTPTDLGKALHEAVSVSNRKLTDAQFFNMDAGLPRWKKLLISGTGSFE